MDITLFLAIVGAITVSCGLMAVIERLDDPRRAAR